MTIMDKVNEIKSGKLSAVENIKNFLEVIEKDNQKGNKLNAVLSVNLKAISDAEEIDRKIKEGSAGKLAGLGFIVKSNICVKGLECNCASKVMEGWIAPFDATVIEKLKKEDAIILGMANMDEFACGGSGETSAFGPCKNPVDVDLIPGGSSSGSASAVGAGFCDFALGSDTGGSIRNPASHCGIVGVKPSYGLVSRYGLMDYAMSLDQIGPLTNDVESASLILDIIKGRDEKDTISYKTNDIKIGKVSKMKIGVIKPLAKENVQSVIDEVIQKLKDSYGWEILEVEIKYIDVAVQTYYPLAYVELFSSTRKYDGRRFGKKIEEFAGPELLRRILGGQEISRAEYGGRYYKKSLQVKEIIKKEFEKAFESVDCIIVPTCPGLPWKIGESMKIEEIYAYDALTIPANLAELCAITLPAKRVNNIPVGIQVMCAPRQESKMLSIAKMIEDLIKVLNNKQILH